MLELFKKLKSWNLADDCTELLFVANKFLYAFVLEAA